MKNAELCMIPSKKVVITGKEFNLFHWLLGRSSVMRWETEVSIWHLRQVIKIVSWLQCRYLIRKCSVSHLSGGMCWVYVIRTKLITSTALPHRSQKWLPFWSPNLAYDEPEDKVVSQGGSVDTPPAEILIRLCVDLWYITHPLTRSFVHSDMF